MFIFYGLLCSLNLFSITVIHVFCLPPNLVWRIGESITHLLWTHVEFGAHLSCVLCSVERGVGVGAGALLQCGDQTKVSDFHCPIHGEKYIGRLQHRKGTVTPEYSLSQFM